MENPIDFRHLFKRFQGYEVNFTVEGTGFKKPETKTILIKAYTYHYSDMDGHCFNLQIEGIGNYKLNKPREIEDLGHKIILDYSDNFLKAESMSRGGQDHFSRKLQKELIMTFEYENKKDYDRFLEIQEYEDRYK